MRTLIDWLAALGATADDSDQERLAKAILTFTVLLGAVAGLVWGILYATMGLLVPAGIPLVFTAASLLGVPYFAATKSYRFFRSISLALMLSLPYALQWSLGGFVQGSAVMVWAFLCPMGALLFLGPRRATPWFAAFVGLALVSGLIDPWLPRAEVPTWARTALFVMNIGAVALITWLLLQYFVQERNRARARSEKLLLNVLPASIAAKLKDDSGVVADRFDEATIVFADLVGFTPLSARIQPQRMVGILNEIFTAFDALAQRHGIEKIRTIGDGWMAVGGVPDPMQDHARAVAEVALGIQDFLASYQAPDIGPVQARIGIDTGPVVGAVVGTTRFHYDVWSDAVNTAARMESHGLPGRIQVSEAAFRQLRSAYLFEERGPVEIKGKGTVRTWWLRGRREADG